jgi:uncharacterized protein (DUF1800 family)
MSLSNTERLYDLTNVYEVSDGDIRAILERLLEKLNLVPTKTTYIRKGIEIVSYSLEPTL